MDLRPLDAPLRPQALALNAGVEAWTSPLDADALDRLLGVASFAEAAVEDGRLLGFLVGMTEGSAYWGRNFLWLRERLPRMAYVDRVIVAPEARGRGLAAALYARFAAASGGRPLACEVATDPPNPGSEAFHARLGFTELGRAEPWPGHPAVFLLRAQRP